MHRRSLARILATLTASIPAGAGAALPERESGTYYGGAGAEAAFAVMVDAAGNVHICGQTGSAGMATPGAHQTVLGGTRDALVAKFGPDGDRIWSTYLGGAMLESCNTLAVDSVGGVLVAGRTNSADGIATVGALQPAAGGMEDGFLVKLGADGKRLWGTYLGSAENQEYTNAVATGADDSVYVAGDVLAPLFPLPGPHDKTFNGLQDAYVLRLTPGGEMIWGTYIGGPAADGRPYLAVRGDVVAVALEASSSGLATPGAFAEMKTGSSDPLIARFDTDGVLQWATYYGSNGDDAPFTVAVTLDGGIAVAGQTSALTNIASPGAHQGVPGGGIDSYVVRFEANGARRWATYLGGAQTDNPTDIFVDVADNILVMGVTNSLVGIATPSAHQPAPGGGTDGYIVKFDPVGVRRWGTYYGGTGQDFTAAGQAVGYDRLHVVGHTNSMTGIATPDGYQPANAGDLDVFMVRFGQGQGDGCELDTDCEAGFCTDGVCCDGPCGGDAPDCRVCSVAAGADVDGTCTVAEAGATCRPAASACDTAELCAGNDPTCPPDLVAPDGAPCRDGACLAGLCSLSGSVPAVDWGTYAGGVGDETGGAVAVDGAGNIYLAGTTASLAAIASPGTHQDVYGGGPSDAFLLKLSPEGERIWGTYLGGPGSDVAVGLTVDAFGDVVVTGATTSTTGIATPGALQTTLAGGHDGFAALFTPDGQRVWGTYLGSVTVVDEATTAAAIDDAGDVYLTGDLGAALPFPLPGPHDPTFNGGVDAYLIKLTHDGALIWGSYYGGANADHGRAVAVDAGFVHVAGITGSPAGIASPGALDEALDGPTDGFVARFDVAGDRDWGTYLGGEGSDSCLGLAATADGGVAGFGATDSSMDIATPDAHQSALGGGRDAMVVRLDAAGGRLWSTYYGGAGDEDGAALDLDPAGALLLTGTTNSPTSITTADSLHPDPLGGRDVFVVKLDPSGARRWGTYYGGTFSDTTGADAIVAVGLDSLYLAGQTSSSPGIAAMDALFQPDFGGGGSDLFLVHLSYGPGYACHADSECDSGFCVDGVCCDSACGGDSPGDCQACSVAAGGAQDGTCSVVADATPCAEGLCMSGTCTPDDTTTTTDADTGADPTTPTDADTGADPTTPTGGNEGGGSSSPGEDSGVPTGGAPGDDTSDAQSEGSSTDATADGDGGCGCRQAPAPRGFTLLALLTILARRRGRARRG